MKTLREYRNGLKLTQEAVAKAVGVHVQQYSRWENGTMPRKSHRVSLAKVFGVHPREVSYHGEDTP